MKQLYGNKFYKTVLLYFCFYDFVSLYLHFQKLFKETTHNLLQKLFIKKLSNSIDKPLN